MPNPSYCRKLRLSKVVVLVMKCPWSVEVRVAEAFPRLDTRFGFDRWGIGRSARCGSVG